MRDVNYKTRVDKYFEVNDFEVHTKELKPYYDDLKWIYNGESLFVYGNPGTHKTGQITSICKKFFYGDDCATLKYYRATELVYQCDDEARKCKMLVIDNLGYDAVFENKRGHLFDIIDYRIHNYLTTVIITNEDLSKDNKYDLALLDRFKMFKKIKIDGKSDRKPLEV